MEEEEEERTAKKVLLENLSRQELIRRRREKDLRDKERSRRRMEWKENRHYRAVQGRALEVCCMCAFCVLMVVSSIVCAMFLPSSEVEIAVLLLCLGGGSCGSVANLVLVFGENRM